MTWIVANIRWIMIVSGVLTATMIYAAIAPQAALWSTLGETLNGPVAQIGCPVNRPVCRDGSYSGRSATLGSTALALRAGM